ncbi:MAG: tripartite tricarboxylate transporter substrate binding protein [Burkholderiales bacterium]|jgi:tripartite-type tricarboxylate transporter receptor subunit TctC|nr:tripartite tricarboxylate transporter substrate binding protein [Burkholderiales bacterium]
MKHIARLVLLGSLLSTCALATAQDFPARPLRMILGFAPGGSTDLVARVLAQKMAATWNQQVVVDNRPGANGMIGADLVAKATPDGHTLLLSSIGPMAINASLYKMPYDIVKDFAPVTYTGNVTNLLVVHPSVAAANIKELVALAKAQPGKLTFGSSGSGGAPHMAVELFKILAKVNVVHVPYKGGGPAMADLVGGQISGSFASMPSSIPFVRTGKLRALAVTALKRSPAAPEVPTVSESGIPGFSVLDWQGMFTTAKTPAPVVNKLNAEIRRALTLPDVIEKLGTAGVEIQTTSPEEWGRFVQSEIEKWAKVVKTAGIKLE